MKLWMMSLAAVAMIASSAGAQGRALAPPRGLQPGMVVTDSAGAKVAIISQVGQVRDGRPAVVLDVNGSKVQVLAARLRLSGQGDGATTSLTRSEIRNLELEAD